MKEKTFDRLLFFSMFFLAYWFFGNLYEEIVMVPNHLSEPMSVLASFQGYFVWTNPIHYFVPFTQLAVFSIFFLYFKAEDPKQKQLLKKASIFGFLSLAITVLIVTQINMKIFAADFSKYKDELFVLSILWLLGNLIRLYLVGSSLYFTFETYILRQVSKGNQLQIKDKT